MLLEICIEVKGYQSNTMEFCNSICAEIKWISTLLLRVWHHPNPIHLTCAPHVHVYLIETQVWHRFIYDICPYPYCWMWPWNAVVNWYQQCIHLHGFKWTQETPNLEVHLFVYEAHKWLNQVSPCLCNLEYHLLLEMHFSMYMENDNHDL